MIQEAHIKGITRAYTSGDQKRHMYYVHCDIICYKKRGIELVRLKNVYLLICVLLV